MPDQNTCKICGTPSETIPNDSDGIHQKCPRCGEFKLTGSAGAMMNYDAGVQAKISGWVFDRNKDNTVPMITSDILKKISARPLPTVADRANRLLLEALRGQKRLGDSFRINDPRFIAATYSDGYEEVNFLFQMLWNNGLMKPVVMGGQCEVQPEGYIAADKLTRGITQTGKGFVAMSFCGNLDDAYQYGFQTGIVRAGYDPVRVDRVEHVNRIDDEIIAQIRAASFVVADFTGHRGGVYFEAGFALGLDLPVIWTCKKCDMKDLHFDIRQYNTIDWETPEDLSSRLQHRIEAIVGKGPKTVLDS